MRSFIREPGTTIPTIEFQISERLKSNLPLILPIVLAIVFILVRILFGQQAFLYESALTILALMCYLIASSVFVTNLFVKENYLNFAGLLATGLGYCFNLSGWMIRWIEAGEKEGWLGGKVWRYFPLDNLYSLTLGFCAGAALATLVIIRNPKYRILGVLALPIISIILLQAFFFGGEIRTLPPILNSYWLPMHVTTATFGYGTAAASVCIALAYLLKDGMRLEAFAIAITLFGLLVLSVANGGNVLFHAEYGPSLTLEGQAVPLRSVLPIAGRLLFVSFLALLATLAALIWAWKENKPQLNVWAWRLFGVNAIIIGFGIGVVFYQISHTPNAGALAASRDYGAFGAFLAENMQANVPVGQQSLFAQGWLRQNGSRLALGYNSNPVEFAAFFVLTGALLMTWLIALKREAVVAALPSLDALDALLYRTVGVVVPLLTLLLITGAVWANESWGRYWGWDPKEVGALVSWIAFAGYLHLRFVGGWRGRRSVYIVLIGFVLIIFTWLGVSYLLPGLHSYA